MSKIYYQCLLFKQFTTVIEKYVQSPGCQRSIINVYFSSNSQPQFSLMLSVLRCQRSIINVYFSSNSQPMRTDVGLALRMSKIYYQCLLFKQLSLFYLSVSFLFYLFFVIPISWCKDTNYFPNRAKEKSGARKDSTLNSIYLTTVSLTTAISSCGRRRRGGARKCKPKP